MNSLITTWIATNFLMLSSWEVKNGGSLMKVYKKMILGSSFSLIILLCLVGVYFFRICGKNVFSATELERISKGNIHIKDDTAASKYWIPNNEKSTLSEVTTWLKNSNPYRQSIPKTLDNAIFAGNILPASLVVNFSNAHEIIILPATYIELDGNHYKVHFITDVLQFSNDGKITYIKSKELYDWLKNDKWQAEFSGMRNEIV